MKLYFILILFIKCFLMMKLKEEPLTVHVVPHSHDDAGWLLTFDQYYYGTGNLKIKVEKILDNMVKSLDGNNRTFIYVEISFFRKWYLKQTEEVKQMVKSLLHSQRFEFINGGYVMHDEATTYYQHLIDQMRLGLLFLKEEFDFQPEIAWFIDPFGHSAANAHILSKMGFTKIVFVRIDEKEKNIRRKSKELEFYWNPFSQVEGSKKIFTHVTYDHYCPPHAMKGMFDDKLLFMNAKEISERSENLMAELKKWNSGYKHKHLMIMYGCDFTFNERDINFINLEYIMNYINKYFSQEIRLIYSTPSKYFNEILNQPEIKYSTTENQDFYPYAEYPHSYWTGFYTSRPNLKFLVRESGNYLTTSSRLMVDYLLHNRDIINTKLKKSYSTYYNEALESLFNLRENLAICQHHDAVAGTAKEKVSEDYENRLITSNDKIKDMMTSLLFEITSQSNRVRQELIESDIKVCLPFKNNCNVSFTMRKFNKKKILLVIYNPGLEGLFPINIRLKKTKYTIGVYNISGDKKNSDMYCIDDEEFKDEYPCELTFFYFFKKSEAVFTLLLDKSVKVMHETFPITDNELISLIDSKDVEIKLNSETLDLSFHFKPKNIDYTINISHAYFSSNMKGDKNPDGAYVFQPKDERPNQYTVDYSRSFYLKGLLGTYVIIRFEHSYLVFKLFCNPLMFELETIWDPILDKKNGMNYLLLLKSDIDNEVKLSKTVSQPEFWTDSNGIKMMRRHKDFRVNWNYDVTEKVSANFYPINTAISIRENKSPYYSKDDYKTHTIEDRMVTLLVDRPESGGVISKGEMMLILNRHSSRDDWKGLEEALYEKSSSGTYFRVKHVLAFGSELDMNFITDYFHNSPGLFVIPDSLSFDYRKNTIKHDFLYKSILDDVFQADDNLVVNFHILTENKIFLQVFNKDDKYFNNNPKEGTIAFKEEYSDLIKEYKLSGTEEIEDDQVPVGVMYKIKPQDFKLFLLQMRVEQVR